MSGVVSATVAVVAIGFAAAEVAAVTATTLSIALAVTAAVGATVSAVGAITGDKTLQYIGMAVGAVGAIGSLANSAGLFASEAVVGGLGDAAGGVTEGVTEAAQQTVAQSVQQGTDAATWATTPVAEAPVTVENIAAAAGYEVPGQAASVGDYSNVGIGSDVGESGTQTLKSNVQSYSSTPPPSMGPEATPPTPTPTADAAPVTAPTGGAAAPPAAPQASTVAPPVVDAPAAPVTGAVNPYDLGVPGSAQSAADAAARVGPVSVPIPAPGSAAAPASSGGLGGIMEFMNKNAALTMGTFQAASSFFAGAFGGGSDKEPTEQQLNAWQAQANQNTAAANLATWQLANMQSGVPRAVGGGQISVTPPKAGGLLNNPPKVTGVPA